LSDAAFDTIDVLKVKYTSFKIPGSNSLSQTPPLEKRADTPPLSESPYVAYKDLINLADSLDQQLGLLNEDEDNEDQNDDNCSDTETYISNAVFETPDTLSYSNVSHVTVHFDVDTAAPILIRRSTRF
jgi:hypothetical protein